MGDFFEDPMVSRFRGYLPVVVDVETAGFNAQTDALLEVAMVIMDMDEKGMMVPGPTMSAHIKPFEGANIEQSALDFTGIDPFDPERDAEDEDTALNAMFKTIRKAIKVKGCKRAILVGHNAHFDLGFINAAIARNDIKRSPFHPFSGFDTATLCGLALGHTVLARSCKLAGIEFDNKAAHSALYDTEKTAELFALIVNQWQHMGGWEWAKRKHMNESE
ncbi:ribonuclease T [Bermanella sp. R86510]|uniref:ribonuclease T n=1 Tax=unclassified Bermanella TaxID=2627862 RepID=UPI0037C8639C